MSPNQFLPAPPIKAPVRKVASTGSNRSFEFTVKPAENTVDRASGSENWVDDFLERDLTRIVVSQLNESEDEIFALAGHKQTPASVKDPVEKSQAVTPPVEKEVVPVPQTVVAKVKEKEARPVIMSSPDPKTQQIFNELNKTEPLLSNRTEVARMPENSVPEPRKVPAESEFEAFLADMFSPADEQTSVSQASSVAKTSASTSAKLPSLSASAERDFLQFLGGF